MKKLGIYFALFLSITGLSREVAGSIEIDHESDYKAVKSQEYYFIVPKKMTATLTPVHNNFNNTKSPKCDTLKEMLQLQGLFIDKCIDDNPRFKKGSDCSAAHRAINESRFEVYLHEGMDNLNVGFINDSYQEWNLQLSEGEINKEDLTQAMMERFNTQKKNIQIISSPEQDKSQKMSHFKISLGDQSILKRLLSAEGLNNDKVIFSQNRFGDLITMDRVLACDLLAGNAYLSIQYPISLRKEVVFDEKTMNELFSGFQDLANSQLAGNGLMQKAAMAGIKFQKVFGPIEDRLSAEEYMGLFKKIYHFREAFIYPIQHSKESFSQLFPVKQVHATDFIAIEAKYSAESKEE
jgi:hypothetical protein